MIFNTIDIIDVNHRKGEYTNNIKKLLKKPPRNGVYDLFKQGENNDVLDIFKLASNLTFDKGKRILFLMFGIEDIIGFSDYTETSGINNLEKYIFNIISANPNPVFLNSKRSLDLFNKLNSYFYINDKMKDFNWLEENKKLKIKGLFIGKNFDFSSIEIQWLKSKYKNILIDKTFSNLDVFKKNNFNVIEFESIKVPTHLIYLFRSY